MANPNISKTDLIVKDNDFIEASHSLDLVEQRIIFLAIIKARKNSDKVEETLSNEFVIHASEYMEAFNVERHTAYECLKNGVEGLLNAKFIYRYENKNNNIAHRGYNLTSWIEYVDKEACVSVKFSPDVVPLIVGLNKKFTSYELQQIVNLQSRYAVRLYELLIRWRDTKILKISLEELRFCLGIKKTEYILMSNFKNRVLDLAVQQVNKFTDITTNYIQKKEGRKIVGFEFYFTIKQDENNKSSKQFKKAMSLEGKHSEESKNYNKEELLIITSKAKDYIAQKKITDPTHKKNILKIAKSQGWGLDEYRKSQEFSSLKNKEIESKINQEKIIENKNKITQENIRKHNENFISFYEQLTSMQQELILDSVQVQISSIPIVGKQFIAQRKNNTAYKDIMFRIYFKNAMKDIGIKI